MLRYFVALAEELHFGRAAHRLSLSQPPLSRAIRQFEEELEIELFDRNARQLALTPAGVALYQHAVPLLLKFAALKNVAHLASRGVTQSVRIGFTASTVFMNLPTIISRVRSTYPDLDFNLFETSPERQLEALRAGDLDVAFTLVRSSHPDIRELQLDEDTFSICLPASHRLASRSSLSLRELSTERFVFISRRSSPQYHELITTYCASNGITLVGQHEALTLSAAISLVAEGYGVSLVPGAMARSGYAGVAFVPIQDMDVPFPLVLIWSSAHEKERAVDAVVQVARKYTKLIEPDA